MNPTAVVYAIFVAVAMLGLLAAARPRVFAQYFLAKWQRQRLAGNMSALSWTGWILFAGATFAAILTLVADRLYR